MTLSDKDKIELAQYRMAKATGLLKDAETLLAAGSYESSVNRSYYAVLIAVRSLLILRGIDADTHEGAKTMLSREFIRTNLLPRDFGETFRLIQARRIDSDYGDYIEIAQQEAHDSFTRAQEFVHKARELGKRLIEEMS
jgi:uncharacterized protein (UPF0332 family)